MRNLGQLMKQAQEMQSRMESLQQQLATIEVTGESGAGLVRVTMTAKGEWRRVQIDPTLVNPAEVDVLEDLLVAAGNDARAKAEAVTQAEMAKLTGGLQLPGGLKLPF